MGSIRMNIIQQYELKYITFDQLSEEIWGYGQRLINEVGVERFFCSRYTMHH
jgi:hypothetical protein